MTRTLGMGLAENFSVFRGIAVADQPGVGAEQLRVGELHLLLAARFDGEDAHLEQVTTDVLEEGGIAVFADDVLVELPRLVGGQEFGGHLTAVHFHAEPVDLSAFGHRKDVGPFELLVVGVVELLVDGRGGHLVAHRHVHVVIHDLQGAKVWTRGGGTGRGGEWVEAVRARARPAVQGSAPAHGQ
ncbi:MAG: hypothetical protein M5U12_06165 [Verrucomicrobia bacterium]|nr:hypothetical protein [Verrucomicrobiota bacterium]